MSTMTIPEATTTLPACPWWCTCPPAGHSWDHEPDGSWTRVHRRQVGGFTMSATEWAAPGVSRILMHPTLADCVLLDTAARADELSEDLHQVAAILRQIESVQVH